jgi:hypothetical protein
MYTAAVFLDIEKAFDTTWHPGLLYKLHKLKFSTNFIKLVNSFLSKRKFTVSVEGEMSTPREIQALLPQGSRPVPILSSTYLNVTPPPPKSPGVYLALFAYDTYTRKYATVAKKIMFSEISSAVSIQLRRGASAGTLNQ